MSPLVLVVDDDESIRETIEVVLQDEGYRVALAADGAAALRAVRAGERPAVILLDLMMPNMDGEQVLAELARAGFGDVPVVVMSGHTELPAGTSAAGAAAFLRKPLAVGPLLGALGRIAPAPGPPAAHA